ncbi:hypothetical protein OAI84_00715 [bacterium]|nr:hypothetical protein [bacterium]
MQLTTILLIIGFFYLLFNFRISAVEGFNPNAMDPKKIRELTKQAQAKADEISKQMRKDALKIQKDAEEKIKESNKKALTELPKEKEVRAAGQEVADKKTESRDGAPFDCNEVCSKMGGTGECKEGICTCIMPDDSRLEQNGRCQ